MAARTLRVSLVSMALALVATAGAAVSPRSAVPPASAATPAGSRSRLSKSPEPVGPIGHEGRWLTDADGRVVLLHGVNMVEKTAPYYPSAFGFGAKDAAWLLSNGLRVVRLGVLGTGLMPSPGRISHRYLSRLAAEVTTLGRHHIYVLLDLHQDGFSATVGSDGFPAWMTLTGDAVNDHAGFPEYYLSDMATQEAFQSLWDNAKGPDGVGLETDVAEMVGALASTFAHTPNLLGYDIFNEPWPGTTWTTCLSAAIGCPSLVARELDPFYEKVDRAIRAHDRDHLIFFEPFVLFNFGDATTTLSLPRGDHRTGMSFHEYAVNLTDATKVLANAVAWSARTGGALLLTEFSTTSLPVAPQVGMLDNRLLPWIYWSFDGHIVKKLTQPPDGANLAASTVDAIVQPYPLVIAGTPASAQYDPTTHTFTASWSVVEPSGRRAPPGSVSSIEMPKADYPAGYTEHVTGGRVTSAPCAPLLTVSSGTAARVSLAVAAGGHC